MKHVSASQITTFRDCPRKWYFEKVVGLPRPSTGSTELGSAVHAVLEDYLRGDTEGIAPTSEAHEIAMSGLVHLPVRGPHLRVELGLADEMPIKDSPRARVGLCGPA